MRLLLRLCRHHVRIGHQGLHIKRKTNIQQSVYHIPAKLTIIVIPLRFAEGFRQLRYHPEGLVQLLFARRTSR